MRPTHICTSPAQLPSVQENQLISADVSQKNEILPSYEETTGILISSEAIDLSKDEKIYYDAYYDEKKDFFLPEYEKIENGNIVTKKKKRSIKSLHGLFVILTVVLMFYYFNQSTEGMPTWTGCSH